MGRRVVTPYCTPSRLAQDGVSLWTEYRRTPHPKYEVRPVQQVLFRPALFEPPPFATPGPGAKPYWVLCDNIYGNF